MPVSIIPKSFLRCCLSNAEDGTQDDIFFWNSSEQSGEGASSSSENECMT
jgi:hypothetical protein